MVSSCFQIKNGRAEFLKHRLQGPPSPKGFLCDLCMVLLRSRSALRDFSGVNCFVLGLRLHVWINFAPFLSYVMSGPRCHGPFTGRLFQVVTLWSGWLWTLPYSACSHVPSRDSVIHSRMTPHPLGKVYLLSHLTEIFPAELWEQFLINVNFFELFRRKVSFLLFGIILAKMI